MTLEGVRVSHEGLIFSRARIYAESFANPSKHSLSLQDPSHFAWFLCKNYMLRPNADRVGSALWVTDNYADNYFHWLVDCLTRVVNAMQLYPSERLILLPRSYARHAYVNFTLGAFPEMRVRWIGPRRNVDVARLNFVPRRPPYFVASRPYRRDLLQQVADRIVRSAGEPGGPERRIYFSRADASRRRARNEAEVIRTLHQHDVEVFKLDANRPWEQVRASRVATTIIGVHGAALTNMVFMRPGGRVIELQRKVEAADLFFYDWYGPLADTMSLEYKALPCEAASTEGHVNPHDADIIVDLDLLREALK